MSEEKNTGITTGDPRVAQLANLLSRSKGEVFSFDLPKRVDQAMSAEVLQKSADHLKFMTTLDQAIELVVEQAETNMVDAKQTFDGVLESMSGYIDSLAVADSKLPSENEILFAKLGDKVYQIVESFKNLEQRMNEKIFTDHGFFDGLSAVEEKRRSVLAQYMNQRPAWNVNEASYTWVYNAKPLSYFEETGKRISAALSQARQEEPDA